MAKTYFTRFGAGDPRTFTGLAPTFLIFVRGTDGQTLAPPSVTETLAGSGIYQFVYGVTQPIAFLMDAATTSPGVAGRYVTGSIDPVDRADEYGNTLIAYGLTLLAYGNTNAALGATLFSLGTTAVALGITGNALGTTNVALGITNIALGITSVALGNTAVALGMTNVALGQSSALFSLVGTTSSSIGSTGIDPTTIFGFLMRAQEISEGNQTYTKASGVLDLFTRGATLLREKTIADTSTQTTKT